MYFRKLLTGTCVLLLLCFFCVPAWSQDSRYWTTEELKTIRSLWIGSLPSLPKDPSNRYADDPKAVALGQKFFFDSRFSGNVKVSCATCHPQNENFADNLPLAHGIGTTTRRTMPLVGVAYNTWFFWDGRKDSLWSQALAPLESAVEHGFTRTRCALVIMTHYRKEYEEVFGPLPPLSERDFSLRAKPSLEDPEALKAWIYMPADKRQAVNAVYANMGKAIAAFVRTILPLPSRFDRYVESQLGTDRKAEGMLTPSEIAGLKLFIGKAKCINCHSGPLFTNGGFHPVPVPQPAGLAPDRGRAEALAKVLADDFNCLSSYSDAKPQDCGELRFLDVSTEKYVGAFKTPSLRNVAERPPYMHAGQLKSLKDVLDFYRKLKPGEHVPADLEHSELTDAEAQQLEAFLRTLSGPVSVGGPKP